MPSDGSRSPRRAPSGRPSSRSGSGSGRPSGAGSGAGAGKGRSNSTGGRPAPRSSSARSGGAAGGSRATGRSGSGSGGSWSGTRSQGGTGGRSSATSRGTGARTSGRPATGSGRSTARRDGSERPASTGASSGERARPGSSTRTGGRTGGGTGASRRSGDGGRPTGTRTGSGSGTGTGADRRRPSEDAAKPLPRGTKKWGNVARRGAREVTAQREPEGGQRNTYFIDERTRRKDTPPPPRRQEHWVRADGARQEWEDAEPGRGKATGRGRGKRGTGRADSDSGSGAGAGSTGAALAALSGKRALPADVATEIRNAADVATAAHRERLVERAESAFGAFERGRFQDALRAIKPVADEAPAVADVRELAGLAAYRCGKWREAARHLKAFGELGDSTEHLPILMDCQRALHKPKKVAELWAELRQRSPEPDVLAEGRIVAAASLADGGDLNGAIAVLATAGASKALRNPSERHLRQWYLLADLYERAGDVPRAREYFERVLRAEPGAYDVADRLRGLGPERRPRKGANRRPMIENKKPAGKAARPAAG
jgi:hypothetical protein